MIRRPPRSTQSRSSAASDVYKRQQRKVTGLAPWVFREVGGIVELAGIDEDRDRDCPALVAGPRDQRAMAGVKPAHRRYQAQGAGECGERVVQLGAAPDDVHGAVAVSYTHLRAHETRHDLVCRLL